MALMDLNGIKYDASDINSGTGNYDSFLRIQNNDEEQGFNTDTHSLLNNKDGNFTHSLLISSLQVVNEGGIDYYQIRLDLNETNSKTGPAISLDELRLYVGGAATSVADLASLTKVYDLQTATGHSLALTDLNTGSGTDDYFFMIPVSLLSGGGQYLTLYADFSGADGGFEEFRALSTTFVPQPEINIVKETDGTDNQCLNLLTGSTVTWTYHVTNPGNVPLSNVTVTDDNGTPGVPGDDFTAAPVLSGGFNVGDTNQNNLLDGTETWEFSATGTVTAGEYTNTGTASGAWASSGQSGTVTQSETDCYNGVSASISIVKETDGTDNQCLNLLVGSTVNWTYDVSNTGDVGITGSSVVVTDDNGTVGTGDDFHPTAVLSGGFNTGDANHNNILDPGETWHYSASGTVTAGEYTNTGSVNGTAKDDANHTAPVSDSETDCYNGATASISIVKETDGTDNQCLNLIVGSTVNWTYDVTNTGDVGITGSTVVVTDDNGTAGTGDDFTATAVLSGGFNTGDANHNNILDPGETWHYSASGTVTAGEYTNTGTVNGTAKDDANHTTPVSDSEADCYNGVTASVSIVKETNGTDNQCLDLLVGSTVNWTYDVTNTGDVGITGSTVVVTDDNGTAGTGDDFTATAILSGGFNTGDTNSNNILDPGETWHYSASGTVTAGEYNNTGTVNGTAKDDANHTTPVSDSETDCYNGISASISIVKETDGTDNQCLDLLAGTTVNWTYDVTNTGDAAINGSTIVVTDDNGTAATGDDFHPTAIVSGGFNTGDANSNNILDPGETWHYSASGTVTAGEYTNTGSVNGTAHDDSNNTAPVSDSETDCYNGVNASLSIVKETDGTDNQCLDLITGSTVNWTYDVTNTGDIAIDGSTVTVTDDNGTAGTGDDFHPAQVLSGGFNTGDLNHNGFIDVGETWHYSASGTVTAGEYTNTGSVNGTAKDEANHTAPVSDSETDCYNGSTPSIDIVKETNGTDNECPVVMVGDSVTWTYDVSNNSVFGITNVVVTDDNGTAGNTADDFHPAAILSGGFNSGDANHNNILDPGETWHYSQTGTAQAGHYENVGSVNGTATDGSGHTTTVTNSESDCYLGLSGPCPRTPGFWAHWTDFWNGTASVPKQAGQTDFPTQELLYAVDSNHNGSVGAGDVAGLLIGDWNKNGIQDSGEDVIFVNYQDALTLINANNKMMSDGVVKIGRDVVATWLNYLMGSPVGLVSDTNSPAHFINDAVNYLQIFGDSSSANTNNPAEVFDTYSSGHTAVKTSSAFWTSNFPGGDHSGAQIHDALDGYNNTGAINGIVYAASCDNPQFLNELHGYSMGGALFMN